MCRAVLVFHPKLARPSRCATEKIRERAYMSRKFFRDSSREKKKSKIKRMSPIAKLLAAGLGFSALAVAQSNPFPTYTAGPEPAGWPTGSFVVSSGQIITPAGTQVDLGNNVRAKAVAINPNAST